MRPVSCVKCERVLMDEPEKGILRIRTRVILISSSGKEVKAMCPQCKHWIVLPFTLSGLESAESGKSLL